MKYNVSQPIYDTINFWICVGLFVYVTGIFFYILLVENSSKSDLKLQSELRLIYSAVTIVKNLILSFALIKNHDNNQVVKQSLDIPSELDLDSFYPNNNLN